MKRVVVVGVVAMSGMLCVPPSHAEGVSVSVGGDSEWGVTAEAKVSKDRVKIGKSVTGTSKIAFTAKVLGIPLPVKGFYVNSFPTSFQKPSLEISNAELDAKGYSREYNSYLGTRQWEIGGSKSFWGSKSVTIEGEARAREKDKNEYFYAGTHTCGSDDKCTNAHAVVRVVTRK